MQTRGRRSGPPAAASPSSATFIRRARSRKRSVRRRARSSSHRTTPEALSVLGTVAFWYEWDYPRAEELLRRAVTRQPSSAESHVYLAHLLSNLGRHDEALVEIRRARELDPNLPIARSLEGQFLFMARRYDEALAHMDSMVTLGAQVRPGARDARLSAAGPGPLRRGHSRNRHRPRARSRRSRGRPRLAHGCSPAPCVVTRSPGPDGEPRPRRCSQRNPQTGARQRT